LSSVHAMYTCFSLSALGLEALDRMEQSSWKPILYGCRYLCLHVFPSLELDLISMFTVQFMHCMVMVAQWGSLHCLLDHAGQPVHSVYYKQCMRLVHWSWIRKLIHVWHTWVIANQLWKCTAVTAIQLWTCTAVTAAWHYSSLNL